MPSTTKNYGEYPAGKGAKSIIYGDPSLENRWVVSANIGGQMAHIMKPDMLPHNYTLNGDTYRAGSYGFCGPFGVSGWYIVDDLSQVKCCKTCRKAADIRYNPLERLARET